MEEKTSPTGADAATVVTCIVLVAIIAYQGFRTIVSAPDAERALLAPREYRCDDRSFFTTDFPENGVMRVSLSGVQFDTFQVPVTSGIRFDSADRQRGFWFVDGKVLVVHSINDAVVTACAAVAPVPAQEEGA